ncbi:hypothetical protein BRC64_11285 [Halobacteriales archaeon QH_10_67_22]|nr:MAG: hypothetical protein BRC64_11285 [Halobacteriales archaeon QH_10_67_22]
MSESPFVDTGSQPSDEQILLAMEANRDRKLLREWLATLPRYSVLVSDPGTPLPDEEAYGLCLLDRATLGRCRSDLQQRRENDNPLFVPYLLVVPEGVADGAVAELVDGDRRLVNDVVPLPVEQAVLHRRIENLLDARRASVRLSERERQYEQLVDLTPEAMLVVRDGEIMYSNTAAVDLFGVEEAADLRGTAVRDLVSDDDWSLVEGVLTGEGPDGDPDSDSEGFQEVEMQTASGTAVPTEVAGVSITFDESSAVQLLVRDLTGEYERKQRLDLFGRAIQAASQGITIADARQDDEPLIYINDSFERITGYSVAEVIGKNCRFLQGEQTDEAAVARLREAIDTETPATVEILNYRKDGTPFWNQVDLVPVKNDDGETTHFLGLQRDITPRKSREERLQVMSRVLRHNLRNRMNVITGHAELLLESDDDETAAAAERILRSADDLLEISERIQEFNSVISPDGTSVESHDLVEVFERVTEAFRSTHPRASVTLNAPKTAMVAGHRLLPVAIEEFVELTARGDETPDLEITVRSDDGWVVAELVDRGETVSPLDLSIMEKATETATEHPQGVELWLIRWAVIYSGGELTVTREDVPQLRIRLPAAATDDDRETV